MKAFDFVLPKPFFLFSFCHVCTIWNGNVTANEQAQAFSNMRGEMDQIRTGRRRAAENQTLHSKIFDMLSNLV